MARPPEFGPIRWTDERGPVKIIRITKVEPLESLWIRAAFSDGAVKEVHVSDLISKGSVVAPIRDRREVFEQVSVNPESHTVEWPDRLRRLRRYSLSALPILRETLR